MYQFIAGTTYHVVFLCWKSECVLGCLLQMSLLHWHLPLLPQHHRHVSPQVLHCFPGSKIMDLRTFLCGYTQWSNFPEADPAILCFNIVMFQLMTIVPLHVIYFFATIQNTGHFTTWTITRYRICYRHSG